MSVEKFIKNHSYINKNTGNIIIIIIESNDGIFILNQYEHWKKCSYCRMEKNYEAHRKNKKNEAKIKK